MPAEPSETNRSRPEGKLANPDWNRWVYLLAIPIVLPLFTPFYNRIKPELFGIPAFYWVQLAFVPMSALVTGMVYLKTRKR